MTTSICVAAPPPGALKYSTTSWWVPASSAMVAEPVVGAW